MKSVIGELRPLFNMNRMVHEPWEKMRLVRAASDLHDEVRVGSSLEVRAWVDPGPMAA